LTSGGLVFGVDSYSTNESTLPRVVSNQLTADSSVFSDNDCQVEYSGGQNTPNFVSHAVSGGIAIGYYGRFDIDSHGFIFSNCEFSGNTFSLIDIFASTSVGVNMEVRAIGGVAFAALSGGTQQNNVFSIVDCLFESNLVQTYIAPTTLADSAAAAVGAGLAMYFDNSSLSANWSVQLRGSFFVANTNNCTFVTAACAGAGLAVALNGVQMESENSMLIDDCTFERNALQTSCLVTASGAGAGLAFAQISGYSSVVYAMLDSCQVSDSRFFKNALFHELFVDNSQPSSVKTISLAGAGLSIMLSSVFALNEQFAISDSRFDENLLSSVELTHIASALAVSGLAVGIGTISSIRVSSLLFLVSNSSFSSNSFFANFSKTWSSGTLATGLSLLYHAYLGPNPFAPISSFSVNNSIHFESNILQNNLAQITLPHLDAVKGSFAPSGVAIFSNFFASHLSTAMQNNFIENTNLAVPYPLEATYGVMSCGLAISLNDPVAYDSLAHVISHNTFSHVYLNFINNTFHLNTLSHPYAHGAIAGSGLAAWMYGRILDLKLEFRDNLFVNGVVRGFQAEDDVDMLVVTGGGLSMLLEAVDGILTGTNLTLQRNTFVNCTSEGSGNVQLTLLGDFPGHPVTNSILVDSSTFTGNAGEKGGAFFSSGDDVLEVRITNCTFINNNAYCPNSCCCVGGGLLVANLRLDVANSVFDGNSASYSGGAISLYPHSYGSMQDSVFVRNIAGRGATDLDSRSSEPFSLTNVSFQFIPASDSESVNVNLPDSIFNESSLVLFQCPPGYVVFHASTVYGCRLCPPGQYLLSGGDWYGPPRNRPSACLPCPVIGGVCKNGGTQINISSSYWGYASKAAEVFASLCPPGYCCNGASSCPWNDTCRLVLGPM
jgi:hypothetical protein